MNKVVQENLVYLNGLLSDKLSPFWLGKWSTVYEAVCLVQTDTEPGYKSKYPYVWQETSEVHQTLMPLFSKEIQKSWVIVHNFLNENIGLLVLQKNQEEEKAFKVWDEAYKRIDEAGEHGHVSWAMESPQNIDDIYPETVKKLYYTNHSGWGNPCSQDLPPNATYFDVFNAINKLIIESGDTHHVFVEKLYSVPREAGSFTVSLGS